VADRLMDLAQGIGFEAAKVDLVPYYVSFLTDAESEVRTAALGRMTEFCRILDKDTIIAKIVPTLKSLEQDQFVYVRCALAENLLTICPKIQKSPTNEHILPIFLVLLRDDDSKVRLSLFKRLEDLNQVIGIGDL